MLENLRIAVKRQKRIILIFFLTILIPSIFLGIFGIRAIRNERFRLAKQLENEHRSAAVYIKSQLQNSFKELGKGLQNLALSSPIMERDYLEIKNTFLSQLGDNPLMEYAFIAYEDGEGNPIEGEQLENLKEGFLDKLSKSRQGLDNEIIWRTYKLDSILTLMANHVIWQIVD